MARRRRRARRNPTSRTFKTRRGKTVKITNIGRGRRKSAWQKKFGKAFRSCRASRVKPFTKAFGKCMKKKLKAR